MKYKKIYLGKSNGVPVYFDMQEAPNKHMLLIGSSGSGKSVQAQNIILNLARQGETVVVLDIHSVFSKEQVFMVRLKNLQTQQGQLQKSLHVQQEWGRNKRIY